MPGTVEAMSERLANVEREVDAMRRDVHLYLEPREEYRAWLLLAEPCFARDWDNDQHAAYDTYPRRPNGA